MAPPNPKELVPLFISQKLWAPGANNWDKVYLVLKGTGSERLGYDKTTDTAERRWTGNMVSRPLMNLIRRWCLVPERVVMETKWQIYINR